MTQPDEKSTHQTGQDQAGDPRQSERDHEETEVTAPAATDAPPEERAPERPLPPLADPLPGREPRAIDPTEFVARARLTGSARAAFERALAEPEDARRAAIEADDRAARAKWDAEGRAKRYARFTEHRRPDYAGASYEGLKPQQKPEKAARWWGHGRPNLMLRGPSGHGKTHLAAAIANEVAAADRDARVGTPAVVVRFWSVVDLLRALRPPDAHERNDEVRSGERARVLQDAKECDLLVLDDLGKESLSEWVRAVLFEIIDARASSKTRGRRTIITLNHDEKDPTRVREGSADLGAWISQRYTSATFSRIKDCTDGIDIVGEELRSQDRWDPFS